MALIAHLAGNRLMNVLKEHPRLVGAVRIVTARAARFCHGVIHVLFRRGRVVCLVAPDTEQRHVLFEQNAGLGRWVSLRRGEASPSPLCLLEFNFFYRLAHLFMAAETKLIPRLQETEFVVCGVGVMAIHAVAVAYGLMDAARLLGYHRLMALRTDSAGARGQELAVGRGVGIMATGRTSGLYRCVKKSALELFLEIHVAGQAYLPLRARFQLELVFLRPDRRRGKKDHRGKEQKHEPAAYVHAFLFHFFTPMM